MLRPIFLACAALILAFVIAGTFAHGQAKFWLGALTGATMALYVALHDSPPDHIERWRLGSEGERKTAKALRPLTRQGWWVRHDIARHNETNIDHVVVGEAGVFLLDSKNLLGEASVERDELRIRRLEDPNETYTCPGLVARMRAASAQLRRQIEVATGVVVWVQPVVVLWARFPQRVAQSSEVFFVHGEAMSEWFGERRARARAIDTEKVIQFLETLGSKRS